MWIRPLECEGIFVGGGKSISHLLFPQTGGEWYFCTIPY
ncbi:hypothetical protein JOD24_003434 [Kroppenstedtia sanguinis]